MEISSWIAALEGEFAAMEKHHNREIVAEIAEAESASITLHQRLLAAKGRQISVQMVGSRTITGCLEAVGENWLILRDHDGEELVIVDHIEAVYPLREAGADRKTVVKVTLMSALRSLRRARKLVSLRVGSSVFTGYIAQVRADHIDLVRQEMPQVPISIPARNICSVRTFS